MTRSLSRAVVAGGVVYSTGTAATPELEALITNPDHWSGSAAVAPSAVEVTPGSVDYEAFERHDLIAEVKRRNTDRAEDDKIPADGRSGTSALIAALKADDGV